MFGGGLDLRSGCEDWSLGLRLGGRGGREDRGGL